METLPKGPWLGINNRLPSTALHIDKVGDFLASGENIDIDGAGLIRRRQAVALLQAMTGAHSLYTAADGTRYLVRGSVLYVVTLPTYAETLFKTLASNEAMSYLEYAGSLYCSNGTDSGRIAGGVWYPMALPTPNAPSVASVGGELYTGRYQVAVAYRNSTTGEEGGISQPAIYDLAAVGGLRITLPGATTGATHVTVYVSTVNGSVPMLAKTAATGTATVDVVLQAELAIGREAFQRYEQPLPAGSLFLHNSRLCSVVGSDIFVGGAARTGYYVPTDPVLSFPSPVTNAISAQNGIYVTADKTYWFAGEDALDIQKVMDVLPYGGVKGTAFISPNKTFVGWFGQSGVVFGSPSGEVEAVMSDNIDLSAPESGVSAVFTDRGYRRVVSCGWCLNLDNKAATQYTGYDFTSISGHYATKADGIYDLSATGDVAYVADFGSEDFGTEALKHLPAVYLGGTSDLPMQLRVTAPGDVDYTYSAKSCGADTKIHRVDPGKGLRANWYGLSLIGETDFTLASVSFAPVASTRRI